MMSDSSEHDIELREREVLRAICSDSEGVVSKLSAMNRLVRYEWRSADHQVIYSALQRNVEARLGWTKEELTAQATRNGFPDIDWDGFFAGVPINADRAKKLPAMIDSLLQAKT